MQNCKYPTITERIFGCQRRMQDDDMGKGGDAAKSGN